MKLEEGAIALFQAHGGILRSCDAIRYGIHPRTLYALRDSGMVEQIQRGLFSIPGLPGHAQPDLVTVAKKVPKGVICLISALFFHRLTTQIPHFIYVAVKQGYKPPKLNYPPAKFFWFSESTLDSGIETHLLEGVSVFCFSKEKTLVDCFKHRNKIGGIEVVLEALRKYWQQGHPRLDLIMNYAKKSHVEKTLKPYLEVIVNET